MGKKKGGRKPVQEEEEADWEWIGDPIPRDVVRHKWPHRKTSLPKGFSLEDYMHKDFRSADEVCRGR